MKRKLRIFSNIAIICLSVCMFAFGVYAANQVSVTTSGTVKFEATGIYATVSRTISGSTADNTHNTIAPVKIDYTVSDTDDPFAMDANLEFENAKTPITIAFAIKNEAIEPGRDLFVKVDGTASDSLLSIVDNQGMWFSVAPQDTVEVEIMLMVKDANTSINNANYNYTFNLQNSIEGYHVLTEEEYNNRSYSSYDISSYSKIILSSSYNNSTLTSYDTSLFNYDHITNIVLPSTLTSLPNEDEELSNAKLEYLVIPHKITTIADRTLSGQSSMSGVLYLPKNLKSIGADAFDEAKFSRIIIKSNNLIIDKNNSLGLYSNNNLTDMIFVNPESFEWGGQSIYFENLYSLNIIADFTTQEMWNFIFGNYDAEKHNDDWYIIESCDEIKLNNVLVTEYLFPENLTIDGANSIEFGTQIKTVKINSTFDYSSNNNDERSIFQGISNADFYIDSKVVYECTFVEDTNYYSTSILIMFDSYYKNIPYILKSIVDADTNSESVLLNSEYFTKDENIYTMDGKEYYKFTRI